MDERGLKPNRVDIFNNNLYNIDTERNGVGQISIRNTKVTPKIIENIPYAKIVFQDKSGAETDISEQVQQFHKALLQMVMDKGSGVEFAIVLGLMDKTVEIIEGGEWYINLSDEIEEKLSGADQNTFIILHNHPNNTLFSEDDIHTFINYSSLYALSVIGNNGDVHIIKRRYDMDIEDPFTLLARYIGYKEERFIQRFLKQIGKFGLDYICEVCNVL